MTTVNITWHKVTNSTFRDFLEQFGSNHGIYMVSDAAYTGAELYRRLTEDQIYIGQAGGGARRESENKTKGRYVKGSLDARYRSGSYTNIPQAVGGTMSLKDDELGINIERPFHFGVVAPEHRDYIKPLETIIINKYSTMAEEYGFTLVNRDKPVPAPEDVTFVHSGDVPSLLT